MFSSEYVLYLPPIPILSQRKGEGHWYWYGQTVSYHVQHACGQVLTAYRAFHIIRRWMVPEHPTCNHPFPTELRLPQCQDTPIPIFANIRILFFLCVFAAWFHSISGVKIIVKTLRTTWLAALVINICVVFLTLYVCSAILLFFLFSSYFSFVCYYAWIVNKDYASKMLFYFQIQSQYKLAKIARKKEDWTCCILAQRTWTTKNVSEVVKDKSFNNQIAVTFQYR